MTVEEVLRQNGYSDEAIKGMESKLITTFSNVLSEAQSAREAAELAQRSNAEFYRDKIVPSLTQWEEERARLDNEHARIASEAAYYKTQNEQARTMGFIPSDAPAYQPRDTSGRYVAGAPGGTPGSPSFDVQQVYSRAGDAIGVLSDIQWEHQKLFGQPLPMSPSELVRQADAVRLHPREYAARHFGWDAKRQELETQRQEAHDSQIRREAEAARDRVWAEKVGSNPDIRQPSFNSKFTDIQKGRSEGTIPDPLSLNDHERRVLTQQMIRRDLAEGQQ